MKSILLDIAFGAGMALVFWGCLYIKGYVLSDFEIIALYLLSVTYMSTLTRKTKP